MHTLKYGDGGEHIPSVFQPAYFTEQEGGKWQTWGKSLLAREMLQTARPPADYPPAQRALVSLTVRVLGRSVHSLLVAAPNAPLGWYLRWDVFNGWTGSLYIPELARSICVSPASGDSPFLHDRNLEDARILRQFQKLGQAASYHYADDSTREWAAGDSDKSKAIALWEQYPHLEPDMLVIARQFLWSFDLLVETRKKGVAAR